MIFSLYVAESELGSGEVIHVLDCQVRYRIHFVGHFLSSGGRVEVVTDLIFER